MAKKGKRDKPVSGGAKQEEKNSKNLKKVAKKKYKRKKWQTTFCR